MSNTLAIAAVTSTIRFVLSQALGGAQPGPVGSAAVTTMRPDQVAVHDDLGEPAKGINVYLHQVTPNHAWNLTDLPTRRADGSLSRRPVAALDLHYLISCFGDDTHLDAQRLLGRAVLALAVTPVLTRDLVAAALDQYDGDTATAFLADADLADQVELVKLAPAAVTVEEMSRLWGMLGAPYLLSLAYTATVVLLEADVSPRIALPVRQRTVGVAPIAPPRIRSVDTDPAHGPVLTGTELHVLGSGLLGDDTAVRIGAVSLPPAAAAPDHLRLVVAAGVPAGIHALQVVHSATADGVTRVTARSNSVPVLVRPQVAVDAVSATEVSLAVVPALHPGQRAEVRLTRLTPGEPQSVRFGLDVLPPEAAPSGVVELRRSDIGDGDWLVRITVDGADSLPELDGEVYAEPRLSLP